MPTRCHDRASPSIAFVATNKNPARFGEDPSFIYRCDNLGAALRELGANVWIGHLSKFPLQKQFDWVVFHRPKATFRFRLVHAYLRSRGTRTLADFDDLVFDPSLAQHSPGVINGQVSLDETVRNFSLHRAALASFSAVTVSTQPLAEAIAKHHGNVEILEVPNTVHWSWHSKPEAKQPGRTERPVIGYFPGTRSHDRDFASISDALARILNRHPEAILRVTGPLTFKLQARTDQISHQEKMPFSSFHETYAGISVNLAPLENTPFTRCKSAIKVIEGAFWNVPTVCTRLPDAERLVGEGALFASGAVEFEQCVERLLNDPTYRSGISTGLRQKILQKANVHDLAREWLDWMQARHAM